MRWMKLEPIIQSEVSQKYKDQYSILTHIYGLLKDGNSSPKCKTEKDTDMQNRLLDPVGEGEGGMIWENSIETSVKSETDHQPSLDAWDKCSELVHWEDP